MAKTGPECERTSNLQKRFCFGYKRDRLHFGYHNRTLEKVWSQKLPGNATLEMSFAPNQLIKQGAKLVTNAEDVIEELPTPVRAALLQAEARESEQRNPLAADGLSPTEKRIYEILSAEQSMHIDDIVENTGLNSSEVLATLFDSELKGIIRQLPGKPFAKVLW